MLSERGLTDTQASKATPTELQSNRDVKPLRMLFPYVMRHKVVLIAALIALVVATLATLAVPMAVRRLIDNGMSDADPEFVNLYFATMIAVVAVLALASASRYFFVTWLGERVVSEVRKDVFAHLLSLSAGFFDQTKSGEVMSRLTADTTQIKAAVGATASIALRNLFLFIGASIAMAATSPELSAIVLGAIPLIVLPIVWFGRVVRRKSRLAQDTLADASAFATEMVGAVRAVQSFTAERSAADRFSEAVERAFLAARSSVLARSMLTAFGVFMVFASIVGVLWIGARDVVSGVMTPGELGQFVLYAVFAAGALAELSQVWAEIALASGAAERLAEILEIDPSIKSPAKPTSIETIDRGAIAFSEAGFAYPTRPEEEVLRDLSFSVQPGETVALVGPSGAGKSTVLQLVQRLYDLNQGLITIGGEDIRNLKLAKLRRSFAFVPQDSVIFGASVADNILFAQPTATREAVIEAAKQANAHSFVAPMTDGYDTQIGERGVTLSGGQKQRIAIARAILRDAPVLLLDEATSALDAESEALVQEAIDRLSENRTTLVIAHRLATVQNADRILVMDKGCIVEEGTHQSLIDAGGLYARLARLQFLNQGEQNADNDRTEPALVSG